MCTGLLTVNDLFTHQHNHKDRSDKNRSARLRHFFVVLHIE